MPSSRESPSILSRSIATLRGREADTLCCNVQDPWWVIRCGQPLLSADALLRVGCCIHPFPSRAHTCCATGDCGPHGLITNQLCTPLCMRVWKVALTHSTVQLTPSLLSLTPQGPRISPVLTSPLLRRELLTFDNHGRSTLTLSLLTCSGPSPAQTSSALSHSLMFFPIQHPQLQSPCGTRYVRLVELDTLTTDVLTFTNRPDDVFPGFFLLRAILCAS
ncbi:hypothetical protein V8E36_000879 [Tilletia maclaganii]